MLADQRRLPPVSARMPERLREFPELDLVYSWATLRPASPLVICTTLPPLQGGEGETNMVTSHKSQVTTQHPCHPWSGVQLGHLRPASLLLICTTLPPLQWEGGNQHGAGRGQGHGTKSQATTHKQPGETQVTRQNHCHPWSDVWRGPQGVRGAQKDTSHKQQVTNHKSDQRDEGSAGIHKPHKPKGTSSRDAPG